MSETPRHDDEPGASGETAPIDTSRTQSVPSVPSPGEIPPPGPPPGASTPGAPAYGSAAPGAPAYGAPAASPPQNPFASPAEGAPGSPYAAPPAGPSPQPPYGAPYPPPQTPGGYGATPGYGAPGYAPPGYAPPGYAPPGYGPAGYGAQGYPGPYAPSHPLRGATIALLVVSALGTLLGLWGLPALILGIIAAARKDEPSTSASLTRWGWIALAVCFVLAIVGAILLNVFVTPLVSDNSFSSGA